MSRILIIDDEPQILRMLRAALVSSGYEVITAANGAEGFATFERSRPDLVITDLSMPIMDGLALTQELRRISKVPVIILSVRATEPVKVDALDAGADDYVTKPFNMPELLARVRAQLRRDLSNRIPEVGHPLAVGDFELIPGTRRVSLRGAEVRLTPKEFDLLQVFLQQPDRVLTHRVLGRAVWGVAEDGQIEKLRVLIAQLRKKIEGTHYRYIYSEPWVGYRLSPAPEPSL